MYRSQDVQSAGSMQQGDSAHKNWKVAFLVNGLGQSLETLKQSNLASVRMRVCLAAEAFESLGAEVLFVDGSPPLSTTHIFVSKPDFLLDSGRLARWTQAVESVSKSGGRVIVDFCDNHLTKPGPRKDFYEWLLPLATRVICNSAVNAGAVLEKTKAPTAVIEDPIEYEARLPKRSDRPFPTLLWFGHRSNLTYLVDFLAHDFHPTIPIKIICLTNQCPIPDELVNHLGQHASPLIDIVFAEWSHLAMQQAAELSDACILPAGIDDEAKAGASSNRLLTALALGLPVAADSLKAYEPFKEFFVDIRGAAFQDFLIDPMNDADRVTRFQKDILPKHSVTATAQDWLKLGRELHASDCATDAIIRLNLGCGDKILPGFINVDLVDERAGRRPDVVCDITNLRSFPSNYADEVMAIHVVEHFWRWEIEDVLREWLRVLKPGGRMVLECPNLRSACEEFLKADGLRDMHGPEGQRSMWVFYGDPKWKDPLMNHRWGYTPGSLAGLMKKVGLTEVAQAPALFKLREPRDMRVVGVKPVSA